MHRGRGSIRTMHAGRHRRYRPVQRHERLLGACYRREGDRALLFETCLRCRAHVSRLNCCASTKHNGRPTGQVKAARERHDRLLSEAEAALQASASGVLVEASATQQRSLQSVVAASLKPHA